MSDFDTCDDFPVMRQCSSEDQQSYGSEQSDNENEDSEEELSDLDKVDWSSEEGEFLMRVYTEWANIHLPPSCQIEHLDGGFRSGVNLHHLMTQLNYEPSELQYPEPRSKEEKRKNCVDLLKQLFPMDDPDNCEDLQDIMDGFVNGDQLTTMSVLVNISREKVVEKVEFAPADLEGAEALKHWMSCAGIRIDSSNQQNNIDSIKKLRNFVQYIGPQYTKGVDKIVANKSETEKRAYLLKLVHIHYGVPPMLHPSADPDILNSACYNDVKLLYVAEVFNSVMITRGNQTESSNPKRVIHEAIAATRAKDLQISELDTNLYTLYKWLQEKVTFLKAENAKIDEGDSRRHLDVLTDLYNIINNEQQIYSKLRLQCVDDHISLQQSIRSGGTDEVFESKKYNIQVIDRMWNSLRDLEEKMENKLENEGKRASNKQVLYLEWNREMSLLAHWMNRWKNFLQDQTPLAYNSANIANRLQVLTGMHKEMEEKAAYVEKLNATAQLITQEYPLTEEEKSIILEKTESVCGEWQSFVKEVKGYEKQLKKMEIEARRLDIIYHEMKDLMTKLDIELHEFYEFFSHRPHCFTVKNCQQVRVYVKEAWEALFPVSLEVDAVLSLAEEVEQLKKKTTIPVNHLTSLSPKYIKQRWESLLIVAASMETWLTKETAKVEYTEKHLTALNAECEWFVREMDHKLNQLRDKLKDSSNQLTDNVHDTVLTITKFRDGAHEKLVSLAEPLIKLSVATPNLHALYKLFEDVESTLHLLNNDISTELALIDSRHISRETVASLHEQYWASHDQLLITEEQFTGLMCDNECSDIEEAKAYVKSLDRDGRCSFSTFVDMNTSCDRGTGNSNKQLCHALTVLADNKPFILESEIKRWLAKDDAEWCLGKMTEYLGDLEDFNTVGDRALDFERFALNITGQRKKLEVDPMSFRSRLE